MSLDEFINRESAGIDRDPKMRDPKMRDGPQLHSHDQTRDTLPFNTARTLAATADREIPNSEVNKYMLRFLMLLFVGEASAEQLR